MTLVAISIAVPEDLCRWNPVQQCEALLSSPHTFCTDRKSAKCRAMDRKQADQSGEARERA